MNTIPSHGETRKETVSQGGGVPTSFSGGDEHSSPENVKASERGRSPRRRLCLIEG
jgi:hypothetical protein